jgi:hypothetical protein
VVKLVEVRIQEYKIDIASKAPCVVDNLVFSTDEPWSFFDGAFKTTYRICGLGFILHLSIFKSYSF